MSGVEEFMKKQEEKKAEVLAYKLGEILNDVGNVYYPTLKWTVGEDRNGFNFYLRERDAGIFDNAYDEVHSAERRKEMQNSSEGQKLKKIMSDTMDIDVSEGKNAYNHDHNVVFRFSISKDVDRLSDVVNKAEANYAKALEKGFEKDFGDYFDIDRLQYENTKQASKEYAALTAKKAVTR